MKGKLIKLIIQIITICVALFTPFVAAACAYYFSVSRKHKLENEEAAYLNYYGPLLTLLTHYKLDSIWYGVTRSYVYAHKHWPDISVDNRIQNLVRENIKYLPKKAGTEIYDFLMGSDELFYIGNDGYKNYESNAIAASNAFDLILIESLTEASKLSKKLGYPDIAAELLHEFQKSFVSRPDNRHEIH